MTRPSPKGFSDSAAARFAVGSSVRVAPDAISGLARHGYSEDEIFTLVVPKRTLARRKAAHEPLTVEETDKVLRLERIAVQAERVFGEPEKAQRWLRKAKRELSGETPLGCLASEAGARVVEEMLFRIEHGIYA
jgi:putative toxin-antitoxin system antitoxin component (TIGR02293 family)